MSGWILWAADAIDSPDAGGKARALARAERAGLPVPPWFVLSATASEWMDLQLRPEIAAAIAAAVDRIAPAGAFLAVRSSATDEDGDTHSFAGQLDSFLDVRPGEVVEFVRSVWQSGFSERVRAYRRQHGLPLPPRAPAVLIQRMVSPRAAGVAFGADPTSGRRSVSVVSAVPAIGSTLVSGGADADTWRVDRVGTIVDRRIAAQQPTLADEDVQRVASLARAAGRLFGSPQDIEWALDDRLWLLQSRPITSVRAMPDPDATLTIWDNSNIVESYSGVTTPLTFSFAREIYEHVYRQFCRVMGVPERLLAGRDETFQNMLGLIEGRLYYNLLNWHRVLAMLPGYRINRRFMEQMMGAKEPLSDDLAAELEGDTARGRWLDALYAGRTILKLLANHATLNRRIDAFSRRLDRALAPPDVPLEAQRIDELIAHYRDLRRRLLLSWDAPIVNDFFAMLFYGLLRTLVMRWCGDPSGTLQHDLIGANGGIVSAEPAVRLQRLARLAARTAPLADRLLHGTVEDILAAAAGHDEFLDEYGAYLAKFGDRTVNELKLESRTLHDDPLPLFRAIGSLARREFATGSADAGRAEQQRTETDSRRRVGEALRRHPLRRLMFGWVLRHAQRRVRDREHLRLERTRLFARVRLIFLEIGRKLRGLQVLDDERDIFSLEVGEVLSFAEGRSTTTDLRALATLRKREFQRYAEGPAPAERFSTHGSPYQSRELWSTEEAPHGLDSRKTRDERQGLGCCPGLVCGPVRIVSDPAAHLATADLEDRSILVAEHTDPGWIMVFPLARGLLVERGSLLSHAAIVARELRIPTVVSLPGLTRWLKDGDWVEMDGRTGLVRLVSPEAANHAA